MGSNQYGNSEEEKRKRSEAIQRIVLPLPSSTLASVAKVLVENLLFRKGVSRDRLDINARPFH